MDRKDNTELEEKINTVIKDLLGSVTRWERIKWSIRLNVSEYLWRYLPMWKIHSVWYMFLIRLHGFKPLKCVDYMGEYTFIFKTPHEAYCAFLSLESRGDKRPLVTGWWYGEEEFEKDKAEDDIKIGWL